MANDIVNLNQYRQNKSNRELRRNMMSALGMEPEWQAEVAHWILTWNQRLPDVAWLNQREHDFLASLMYWEGPPTERQAQWLEAIERRVMAALKQNNSLGK
jgi:hypothetical protein